HRFHGNDHDPAPGAQPADRFDHHAELRARRDQLAAEVAELTFDLGGLTYEMAIRDPFRLDVLIRRAAVPQAPDAEPGGAGRPRAGADRGVPGSCRAGGAPHSRGAVYCWKCGQPLMPQAASPSLIEPLESGGT